jgi:transitional endoplasmic reticulum ATPase
MVQAPTIGWADIGGLDEAAEKLKEGVELPLKNPQAFERMGIRPAKGFLLYGPPGTGKTLLAKAVAKEAEANFISMKSSDLLSKWYGESEQQISRMFARARQVAPCVIFMDEIDSLVPARGSEANEPQVTARVVNTILAEMDGMEELNSIVVIGATNRPGLVDPALLRPGRFDELVYVGAPDMAGRLHILGIHTRNMPLADDVDLPGIAAQTERFTGADLGDVVRRAGLIAIRQRGEDAQTVTASDFAAALADSRATVTEQMDAEYRKMQGELKKRAMEVRPIGFIHEGMLESRRERKHAPDGG